MNHAFARRLALKKSFYDGTSNLRQRSRQFSTFQRRKDSEVYTKIQSNFKDSFEAFTNEFFGLQATFQKGFQQKSRFLPPFYLF